MCNPIWTAWECAWSIYFPQFLFIIIGVAILIFGLLSKDNTSFLSDSKPFIKIKDIELNPSLPKTVRLGLIYIGATSFLIGFLWILAAEIQAPFASKISPTPSISSTSASNTTEAETVIESFPIKIFDYDGLGDSQVQQGWAKLSIAYSEQKAKYLFDYDVPSNGTFGYAGLDFRFEQTQDLTQYRFIKIILEYFDDSTQCELFIKDVSFQGDYFLLGRVAPPGGSLGINGTEYTYEIPISVFTELDVKAVYEVGFSVDTDITQGKHSIIVKQIIFVR